MESFIEDAQAFLAAHRETVESVATAFAGAGGDSSDLDDAVFDIAGSYGAGDANQIKGRAGQEEAISRSEAEASVINNGPAALKVAAILMGQGIEHGRELVMAAVPAAAPRT